jgi:hypothetical protein
MAIYRDLSGNSPFGDQHVDNRIGGHEDIQAVGFRGTTHVITLSGTSQQTPVFSNRCRAVRITQEGTGDSYYALGSNPTAVDVTDDLFTAGAIEVVKVRGGVDRMAFIQTVAGTEIDDVFITEDLT